MSSDGTPEEAPLSLLLCLVQMVVVLMFLTVKFSIRRTQSAPLVLFRVVPHVAPAPCYDAGHGCGAGDRWEVQLSPRGGMRPCIPNATLNP